MRLLVVSFLVAVLERLDFLGAESLEPAVFVPGEKLLDLGFIFLAQFGAFLNWRSEV